MPKGPSRNAPAPRSSRLPNTLGESKRGMQSQSIAPSDAISAPVWQSERNAYSSMGGNGDGAAALCCARSPVAATSVLDTDCKTHELDNLYVVDTSFFPSIGAVNPALTAIANALRVGDHLLARLG